jgi:acetoin utilization protein AcuB
MYMSRDVEVISPEASLSEAIRRMSHRRIRRLVIMDKGAIVGMVCHRDLVNAFPDDINPFSPLAIDREVATGNVATIMKHPVITVEYDRPIEHAARLMTERHIGCLPVTMANKLAGIITESDIFRAFTELLSARDDSVRVTFSLTEGENVLSFLAETTQTYGLTLLSFISCHDGDRRLAVANVRGARVQDFVGELWKAGHSVVSVLRSDERR